VLKTMKFRPTHIAIILIACQFVGCASLGFKPKYEKNWQSVKIGMEKSEVAKLLGKPDSISTAMRFTEGENSIGAVIVKTLYGGWHEKWYYGDSPGFFDLILPVFPFGGRPIEAHIVYFGKDGQIIGLSKPASSR
jgi:hypothetical protein